MGRSSRNPFFLQGEEIFRSCLSSPHATRQPAFVTASFGCILVMEATLCLAISKLKLAEYTCPGGARSFGRTNWRTVYRNHEGGRLVITLPGREFSAPFHVLDGDFPKSEVKHYCISGSERRSPAMEPYHSRVETSSPRSTIQLNARRFNSPDCFQTVGHKYSVSSS